MAETKSETLKRAYRRAVEEGEEGEATGIEIAVGLLDPALLKQMKSGLDAALSMAEDEQYRQFLDLSGVEQ